MPLQGSIKKQLARVRFFEGLQNIWKTKITEMKIKEYLKTLIVLLIKWTRMVKIKHKTYRCCSNYALSKLIVDNGIEIYEEERTHIHLTSPTTIDPLAQDPG